MQGKAHRWLLLALQTSRYDLPRKDQIRAWLKTPLRRVRRG